MQRTLSLFILIVFGISINAQLPLLLNDSILLYYDFEGSTVDSVFDRSDNVLNGGNFRCNEVIGYNAKALEFNEEDSSRVFIGEEDIMDIENFTMMAWVYPYTYGIDSKRMEVCEKTNSYWMNIRNGNEIGREDERGRMRVGCFFQETEGGSALWRFLDTKTIIPLNTWTHLAYSYTGDSLIAYINGNYDTATAVPPILYKTDYNLVVGSKHNQHNLPEEDWTFAAQFDGRIDEFLIVTRVLDDTEINDYYDESTYIETSSDTIWLSNGASEDSFFRIESNTDWTIGESSSWLGISKSSGTAHDTIYITSTLNEFIETREATITVSAAGLEDKEVFVLQLPSDPYIDLEDDSLNINSYSAATGLQFDIESNINWETDSPESWLSFTTDSDSGNASLTFAVTENRSYSTRVSDLLFSGEGTEQELIITQAGIVPAISLNKDTLTFGYQASQQSVTVNSNAEWFITTNETWITPATLQDSADLNLSISVDENSGSTERIDFITFNCQGIIDSVVIVQDGNLVSVNNLISSNYKVYPNPATTLLNFEISSNSGETTIEIRNILNEIVYVTTSNVNFHIDTKILGADGSYIVSFIDSKGEVIKTEKLLITK